MREMRLISGLLVIWTGLAVTFVPSPSAAELRRRVANSRRGDISDLAATVLDVLGINSTAVLAPDADSVIAAGDDDADNDNDTKAAGVGKYANNYGQETTNWNNQAGNQNLNEAGDYTDNSSLNQKCFMTYENWVDFINWDTLGGGIFADNNPTKIDGVQGDLPDQHCILTTDELQQYQATQQTSGAYAQNTGTATDGYVNGDKYSNANIFNQYLQNGSYRLAFGFMRQFCVVQWDNALNGVDVDANKSNDIKDYTNGGAKSYFDIADSFDIPQFIKDYKPPNETDGGCMVFDFQIDIYQQWLTGYGMGYNKATQTKGK
ncbi:hypothetical protein DFS34DRAFT_612957 [Phlyctochytrium arcticum]|nr:hypothetical protein DFS34DRAFT_612957 [Phlyctochytrium arcticum]